MRSHAWRSRANPWWFCLSAVPRHPSRHPGCVLINLPRIVDMAGAAGFRDVILVIFLSRPERIGGLDLRHDALAAESFLQIEFTHERFRLALLRIGSKENARAI